MKKNYSILFKISIWVIELFEPYKAIIYNRKSNYLLTLHNSFTMMRNNKFKYWCYVINDTWLRLKKNILLHIIYFWEIWKKVYLTLLIFV